MVSFDTPSVDFDSVEPTIRPYSNDDFAWAVSMLEATGGRHRVRRGLVVDVAVLPGLVAERNGHPAALLTLARHRDELEFSVIASAPFDDAIVALLLDAARRYASPTCRRIFTICSNADFDVQRSLQKNDFRLCASRPGAIDAVARRTSEALATMIGDVPVRDEVEFDLLLP
jgi:hypothetical protein